MRKQYEYLRTTSVNKNNSTETTRPPAHRIDLFLCRRYRQLTMGKRAKKRRSQSVLKTNAYFSRYQVKFARRRAGTYDDTIATRGRRHGAEALNDAKASTRAIRRVDAAMKRARTRRCEEECAYT